MARPAHRRKIDGRVLELSSSVLGGWPDGDGQVFATGFFATRAAATAGASARARWRRSFMTHTELVAAPGIKLVETAEAIYDESDSSRNQSQRLKVSGARDGIWRGHMIGTVYTRDLNHLDRADFRTEVQKRIDGLLVRVSFDRGPNTPVTKLRDKIPSRAAIAIAIELPLVKGITRLRYEQIGANGRDLAEDDAGRIVELEWDGE